MANNRYLNHYQANLNHHLLETEIIIFGFTVMKVNIVLNTLPIKCNFYLFKSMSLYEIFFKVQILRYGFYYNEILIVCSILQKYFPTHIQSNIIVL